MIPKALSVGEEEFAMHCQLYNLFPVREYTFAVGRKWRFDFFFIAQRLAVEIEGGSWSGGRHTRPHGFQADIEKYNAAALLGIRLLRFTPEMVTSGKAIGTVLAGLGIDSSQIAPCISSNPMTHR